MSDQVLVQLVTGFFALLSSILQGFSLGLGFWAAYFLLNRKFRVRF